MSGMLRIPRSRGTLSGALLVLLGAWGGLIAFIGPYFHFAYTPDRAWSYTTGRLWLEILPGAGALAGGVIVLASSYRRPVALFGTWLAALSGAWFAAAASPGASPPTSWRRRGGRHKSDIARAIRLCRRGARAVAQQRDARLLALAAAVRDSAGRGDR